MAKGAGMIGPNMATLLSVVITDCAAEAGTSPKGARIGCGRQLQLYQRRGAYQHQ